MPEENPHPRSSPEPPVVPGYRLTELLGRGGSGEVWRALPRGGGEPVAVKVLVAGDPDRQAREAALLGELDHPHLVRLVEVVHQPRRGGRARVALVLELLAGGSLAALLARRGRLRPGEVVTAISPVAAALAHAHAAGVVHGDLSPGNVVFTAEGRPVLTDLGVARVLGEEAAGAVTPAYVDPTVARGGAPGPASDVFGAAAAAFHALTGVAPWNAATPADTLAVAAAAGELPDLDLLAPEAPPALRDVIARGLAPDPSDRPTAAEFALDLRHACRPEPVRLPVAGAPDAELGGTGRGPRTELTHQVSRRRAAAEAAPARGGRWPGVLRLPAGRSSRLAGSLLGVAVLLAGASWVGARWAGTEPAGAVAEATTAGETAPAGQTPTAGEATSPVSPTAPAPPSAAPAPPSTPPAPPAGPVGEAPAAEPDWLAVVQALYARRAEAFAQADPAGLDAVYAAGSALLAADRAAVARLAEAGQRLAGFAPRAEGPVTAVGADDRVRVEASDSWAAYAVVPAGDPDGPVLLEAPARASAPVVLDLVRGPDGWRIAAAARPG